MATLKLKYDTMDAIPDGFADLFEEKDGKALLRADAIEGMKTEKDVTAVKLVADKERKDRKAAEAKLKAFEKLGDRDLDELLAVADEVDSLKAQLAAGGKGATEEAVKAQVDARVRAETAKLQRAFDALKTEAEQHKATAGTLGEKIKRSTIDAELTRVALAAKIRPEALPDFLAQRGAFDLSEDGKVVTKDGVGLTPGLGAEDVMAEMRTTRPHWWPESTGGGARGSNGGTPLGNNPFDVKNGRHDITAAGQLMTADPAKAETMAKQAGHASAKAAVKAIAMADVARMG